MIKPKRPEAKIIKLPERTKKSLEDSIDKLVLDLKKEWQKLFGYFTEFSKRLNNTNDKAKQQELDELISEIQNLLNKMNTTSFGAEQALREYNTKDRLRKIHKNVAGALTEIKNFNEFLSEKTK